MHYQTRPQPAIVRLVKLLLKHADVHGVRLDESERATISDVRHTLEFVAGPARHKGDAVRPEEAEIGLPEDSSGANDIFVASGADARAIAAAFAAADNSPSSSSFSSSASAPASTPANGASNVDVDIGFDFYEFDRQQGSSSSSSAHSDWQVQVKVGDTDVNARDCAHMAAVARADARAAPAVFGRLLHRQRQCRYVWSACASERVPGAVSWQEVRKAHGILSS